MTELSNSPDNHKADFENQHSAAGNADEHEPADVIPFEDNPEFADLDRLYRQALNAIEAVESGLDSVSEFIPDTETPTEGVSSSDNRLPEQADGVAPVTAYASNEFPDGSRVTAKQIIEATLFVGGTTLTTRKLCSLLKDNFDANFVDGIIDDLNRQYAAENRPYEIRFGEGGYRMVLRAQFDPVRNRVFGYGPKEIKLSQEALEILSLVAYKQPITAAEVADLGKQKADGMLRQLLRRELISIQRRDSTGRNVAYCTTPRFLEVFGLRDLEELPQADDLDFK